VASHGYLVAAPDHWEVVERKDLPTDRAARIQAVIANRVPDIRLLIDHFHRDEVGLAGHSFGGWAVLATPEVDPRPVSIVAMGPGGSENSRPSILPVKLTFAWPHPVPTLFIAAEHDVPIPLDGLRGIFDRAPEPKRLAILRRADHQHFLDDVEGAHEAVRHANFPGDAAWIPAAMRPVAELMPGEQTHRFVRALSLAHFDATWRDVQGARDFLDGLDTFLG
jgi:dienelactone hydrolase